MFAALILAGTPVAAAQKAAQGQRTAARAASVSGPAPAWYDLPARVAAARKVLADAADAWSRAVTEPAKQIVRDAVARVKDAASGALAAAKGAGSAAASTWTDVRDEIDKMIGTIGGAAVGGFTGGLFVMAALAWLLLQSARRG